MAEKAILSQLAKFSCAAVTTSGVKPSTLTKIDDLMNIPALGGTPEKVEITTLDSKNREYIPGLKDYGDLAFKFLFSPASGNYAALAAFHDETTDRYEEVYVEIELNDSASSSGHGTQFGFFCNIAVAMDEADINAALTFTANCSLLSDITYTAAA